MYVYTFAIQCNDINLYIPFVAVAMSVILVALHTTQVRYNVYKLELS